MPKPVDFYGSYLTIERAEHHIRQLEEVFGRYVRANEKALRANRNRNQREGAPALGGGFPHHTPTIIGDALHNLRAALDHAYCILIEANGGTIHEWSFFPITMKGDWKDRKGSVDGHKKLGHAPSDAVIDHVFNEIQPCPDGKGEDLVSLHKLDIADKHMVLIPTSQLTHIDEISFEGGGGIKGITIVTSNAPALSFGPGAGLEKNRDHKAAFEICFGWGQPFQGEPILPILKELVVRVRETLKGLEVAARQP